MTTIIAGRFEQQDNVAQAIAALQQAGFASGQISAMYVGPAGRHARYPVGGDHDTSAGAEESGRGTLAGSAIGGAVGAAVGAAAPVAMPIGVAVGGLVGAHIGNLVGALGKMKDDGGHPAPLRHSGLLVAVETPQAEAQEQAISVLRQQGASEVERGDGHIVDGDWEDFDPTQPPRLV